MVDTCMKVLTNGLNMKQYKSARRAATTVGDLRQHLLHLQVTVGGRRSSRTLVLPHVEVVRQQFHAGVGCR